jgi:hypothetical protein
MAFESADPDTGSAREDFRLALRGLIHFYTGENGRAYAQLVGEARFDPEISAELGVNLHVRQVQPFISSPTWALTESARP